ncbi:MAG: alpha/beta hydrolase family protein [Acidimicrobiales bacterium]
MSVAGADTFIESEGRKLWGHLARPPDDNPARSKKCALVLAHGFPTAPGWVESSGTTYPEFADRLATVADWIVLAIHFRGIGKSEGDFSLAGWLDDLRAAVAYLREQEGVGGVWLAGFRTGGALALCLAGEDPDIRGVATFSAPADFDAWAANPRTILAEARTVGAVRSPAFPADQAVWARGFKEIRPLAAMAKIPPRPMLLVHGTIDDAVPVADARALADEAGGSADLRIITGAGHRLRHDPRAVAILVGWLERQDL